MESLRGAAIALVKAVWTADADVSPLKVLDVIESSFGTVESGEDLYFELKLMQQEPREIVRFSEVTRTVSHKSC